MKFYGDYHTHSRFSDSRSTIRENVKQAIDIGLKEIGVSDHGYNNVTLSLTRESILQQKLEVVKLRKEFPEIKILHSIEADLIGLDGSIDMSLEECLDFDYMIAGFHRWAVAKDMESFFKMFLPVHMRYIWLRKKSMITRYTDATIKMLEKYPISIMPHIGDTIPVDCVAIAEVCSELGIYLELNRKHYSAIEKNIDKLLTTKVLFIASSDAHNAKVVGEFKKLSTLITKYNIPENRVINLSNKTPNFRKA